MIDSGDAKDVVIKVIDTEPKNRKGYKRSIR